MKTISGAHKSGIGRYFGAVVLSLALSATYCIAQGAVPPDAARAAGYSVNTFHSSLQPPSIAGANATPSSQWFRTRFFSYPPLSLTSIKFDTPGLTLVDTGYRNYGIATAGPVPGPKKWAGVAFGGGAYIEARIKFDPETVARNAKGWPSFWSMAIEHLAGLPTEQWPGQVQGFKHFIEADFFEYDLLSHGVARNYFGGTLHDWAGVYKGTCANAAFCNFQSSGVAMPMPEDTDFSQYHRYGFLWIPATESRRGSAEFYFDGQRVGRQMKWTRFVDQTPLPSKSSAWAFGIIDLNHLVLILGTGERQPMSVQSVDVWQTDD
ncbi:MAG: hypothetical protein ACRYGG_20420, partial [Janthinobacterium lividum]